MKRKFAVFDIDGTLYRNSLFLDVTEELIREGHISKKRAKEHFALKHKWHERAHKESYETFIKQAVAHTMASLEGVSVKSVESIAKQIAEQNHKLVYSYTRDLLLELKDRNYFLIAISGSLREVVYEFMKYYPFDTFASTTWHTSLDGTTYTGEYTHGGSDKHRFLQQIIKEQNLTINKSIAVGDSIGDITMLEMVENPIAFNPEQRLLESAKANHWKIIIERKNAVFELEARNGQYVLV